HASVADLRDLVVGRVAVLLGHELFVVEQARGVVQDLADGDAFSVRWEFRKDFGQGFIVAQLAVVHEQHDGHGSELLGKRGKSEVGVLVNFAFRSQVGHAIAAFKNNLPIADDFDGGTGSGGKNR